jgi:hypothetical protein
MDVEVSAALAAAVVDLVDVEVSAALLAAALLAAALLAAALLAAALAAAVVDLLDNYSHGSSSLTFLRQAVLV